MKMPIYEKRDDVSCGSCGHFVRHYIWLPGRFSPLSVGHCTHPRPKDRSDSHRSCPLWVPRPPERDPPDARPPGTSAPDR